MASPAFADHFSRLAATYAKHRPGHPPELFTYLAECCVATDLAWDAGTGNGQAAVALARHFGRVVATDASGDQIAHAAPHERVEYRVEPAEKVSLADVSVDLVTAAVSVHWFDLDRFYSEVRRVLRPQGVIAVWTYHLPSIEPSVDAVVTRYYAEVVGAYWPDGFALVHDRYRSLPFPFEELVHPSFETQLAWDLDGLAGFLSSWSATRRFMEAEGAHPLERVWDDLGTAWGESGRSRLVRWPLHLRVGRVGG